VALSQRTCPLCPAAPGTATEGPKEFDQQIVTSAEKPLFVIPKLPDPRSPEIKRAVQDCLDRKTQLPHQLVRGKRTIYQDLEQTLTHLIHLELLAITH